MVNIKLITIKSIIYPTSVLYKTLWITIQLNNNWFFWDSFTQTIFTTTFYSYTFWYSKSGFIYTSNLTRILFLCWWIVFRVNSIIQFIIEPWGKYTPSLATMTPIKLCIGAINQLLIRKLNTISIQWSKLVLSKNIKAHRWSYSPSRSTIILFIFYIWTILIVMMKRLLRYIIVLLNFGAIIRIICFLIRLYYTSGLLANIDWN